MTKKIKQNTSNVAKKYIPIGPYCYTIKKIVKDDKYGFRIETNRCKYLDGNWCIHLGTEIMDQCKECGINWND